MRQITNFKRVYIVMMKNSTTGESTKCTWDSQAKHLWIKADKYYIGPDDGTNGVSEMFILGDADTRPEPLEGWYYALGFMV